jgi:hypothetical protein
MSRPRALATPPTPPFDISVPAPTPGSDEALFIALRRMLALSDFWNALNTDIDDAYAHEMNALDTFVAEQPAVGPAGIAVKFQRFCEHTGAERNSIWGPAHVRTINEALARLAKGGAS